MAIPELSQPRSVSAVRSVAVLSMHTSPLAQAGTGDGGGMNVYIRELCAGLARRGVRCEVFTRRDDPGVASVVSVEPGFRVHHVDAGRPGPVQKEDLPALVEEWTNGVASTLRRLASSGLAVEAIHANYWLSGVAGHRLKHELELPLVTTFHTLEKVKAAAEAADPGASLGRQAAELDTIGCSDLLLASCDVEADQLVSLYGADPERIAVVAPGVDHAIFAPGQRRQARRAIGWPSDDPLVLFVGRIQPLKGPALAVEAVNAIIKSGPSPGRGRTAGTSLMLIGGPSGPGGAGELAALEGRVARHRLGGRVHLLAPQRHEQLSTSYRAADVVVVPSRSESFGLVALEAAACGIPVVAAAVGGLTTLVEHGRSGYLVSEHRPEPFAAFLGELISNPDRAGAMGAAGAAKARRYTWAAAAARLEERITSVTSRELVACH